MNHNTTKLMSNIIITYPSESTSGIAQDFHIFCRFREEQNATVSNSIHNVKIRYRLHDVWNKVASFEWNC